MTELTPDTIRLGLSTAVVGRAVECYARAGSTNDIARERAAQGYPEGLLVLADEQVAGRGRLGRGWAAPPGSSLLMSLLLRPDWLSPASAFAITMLAAVALCEAVEQVAPAPAMLKWPNDLMLTASEDPAPRKAAGILSEIELSGGRIAWVVVGMGVNVNWAPSGVVDGRDLGLLATSVGAAAGHPVDRLALLRALLTRLDARYLALREGHNAELFASWRARLATLGQHVTVRQPAGELRGVAEDVEPTGALRLRDGSGTLHTILAGDVGA